METLRPREDPRVRELIKLCSEDIAAWSKTMFPDRFSRPFSAAHEKVFNALEDTSKQQVVITAFRGFGKSSLCHLAYPSREILLRRAKFFVPVSASVTHSIMHTENMKREFCQNPVLLNLFGDQEGETWTKEAFVTANGSMVLPRGRGQHIRGILFGDYRPDLIIVDDFEDSESVHNEELRAKYKRWFFEDLKGCVDVSSNKWRIIVIGTLLHQDSLLANLIEDPSWHHIDIPLCTEELESVWPEFMTNEQVRELYNTYERQGLVDSFYREYMNMMVSTENQPFQKEFFKAYEESKQNFKGREYETFVLVDPAKTTNPKSDDSAIVGVTINRKENSLYVRDIIAARLHPDEVYSHVIAMAKRIKATAVGIEVNSLNEFIVFPFKNELARRGVNLELIELKARGKKEERIRALIPFYRQGLVYHNKNVTSKLEGQLLTFPFSKRDDVMDALAYSVSMLEMGERYMYLDELEPAEPDKQDELDNEPPLDLEEDYYPIWANA